MNLGLYNRKFVVTGASRGIGYSIANQFLEEGASVCLVSRDILVLESAADRLIRKHGRDRVIHYNADCCSLQQMEFLEKQIANDWETIDGVIANVGDGRSVSDPIPPPSQWKDVWDKNFETVLCTARAFLPSLQESNGCLLFISSITGLEAFGAPVDYSTAKAAVIAFAKNLARKAAPDVRVNVVAPGDIFFKDGTWDQKRKQDPESVDEMIQKSVPIQRFGTPEEVADAAVFLCSKRASYITGAILRVDGGRTVGLI